MHLEDRVKVLEKENQELHERLEQLERYGTTRFVTVQELAELMECSVQNIHNKIRTGQILATRKLGNPRIPMCQFLEDLEGGDLIKPKTPPVENDMVRQIFGD